MKAFTPTTILIAGLVLAVAEFLLGAAELAHLLSDTAYGWVTLTLGVLTVVATLIVRDHLAHAGPPLHVRPPDAHILPVPEDDSHDADQ